VRGELGLASKGTPDSLHPFDSNPLAFIAGAYNSGTQTANYPTFEFQALPIKGNSTAPSATLNLLYGNGGTPAETGLNISSKGILTFAPGQTFPVASVGTITGVTAGTDLLGGGTTGNVTLNLDTAKVAQLAANNTFLGTQTISSGDISLPSTASAGSGAITIGGVPYLSGYAPGKSNVFVGNAGNFTTTGSFTTASGFGALAGQTTGLQNTAVGAAALTNDTTGSGNTAVGYNAGSSLGTLTNVTAVGANAIVSQNNSLILGNTAVGTPGAGFVNVGIGTDTPISALEASVSALGAIGPALTLSNPAGGTGAAASIDFVTSTQGYGLYFGPSSRIEAVNADYNGDDLFFSAISNSRNTYSGPHQQTNMVISSGGQVGIPFTDSNGSGANGSQLNVVGISYTPTPDAGPFQTGQGLAGISSMGGGSSNAPGGDGADFMAGSNGALRTTTGGTGGVFIGGSSYLSGGGPTDPTQQITSGDGIYAEPGGGSALNFVVGNAATLNGDVSVTGTLTAATKDFRIDNPSDPANRYLYHASVESSEMMNIYTGNAVTDDLGIATVTLPSWFESLNTDFRYQLTVIGRPAQAWISQEVAKGRFIISTNATGVKVSWQITAVRQDAYAKAHPLIVDQAKPTNERGYYIHPELFGQPAEKQTEWGRHPEHMRHLQSQKDAQRLQETSVVQQVAARQTGKPASAVNRKFAHVAPSLKPIASSSGVAVPIK
jgi:hypothetical protein